jgi:hypothetical protein
MSKYYVLDISCQPGGSRKGDVYVYDNLKDIKQAMIEDLKEPINGIYMASCYGEDILLKVIDKKGNVLFNMSLFEHIDIDVYVESYETMVNIIKSKESDDSEYSSDISSDDDFDEMCYENMENILWSISGESIRHKTDEEFEFDYIFKLNDNKSNFQIESNDKIFKPTEIGIKVKIDWKIIEKKLFEALGKNLPKKSKIKHKENKLFVEEDGDIPYKTDDCTIFVFYGENNLE